jgi:hypothetical protein
VRTALKFAKRRNTMVDAGFNLSGTHAHQGVAATVCLTFVTSDDEGDTIFLRTELSTDEALRLASKLVGMVDSLHKAASQPTREGAAQ